MCSLSLVVGFDPEASAGEVPIPPCQAVSQRLGLVPGLFQWRTGQPHKALLYGTGSGLALAGAFAAGAFSIYYGNQAEDWRGDYRDLPPGLPQADYDLAFDTWHDFEDKSRSMARVRDAGLVLVGILYAANWYDVLTSADPATAAAAGSTRPVLLVRRDIMGIELRHAF